MTVTLSETQGRAIAAIRDWFETRRHDQQIFRLGLRVVFEAQPDIAVVAETSHLTEALEAHPQLRTPLLRYALVHHTQVARTAACNGRHGIEQRLDKPDYRGVQWSGASADAFDKEYIA